LKPINGVQFDEDWNGWLSLYSLAKQDLKEINRFITLDCPVQNF
jgi:hypothetical protein